MRIKLQDSKTDGLRLSRTKSKVLISRYVALSHRQKAYGGGALDDDLPSGTTTTPTTPTTATATDAANGVQVGDASSSSEVQLAIVCDVYNGKALDFGVPSEWLPGTAQRCVDGTAQVRLYDVSSHKTGVLRLKRSVRTQQPQNTRQIRARSRTLAASKQQQQQQQQQISPSTTTTATATATATTTTATATTTTVVKTLPEGKQPLRIQRSRSQSIVHPQNQQEKTLAVAHFRNTDESFMQAMMCGEASTQGVRSSMEDESILETDFHKTVQFYNPSVNTCSMTFAGVYDGHGGQAAAGYIKKYLHLSLARNYIQTDMDLTQPILDAYREIDKELIGKSEASGACAINAIFEGKCYYIAHVGDCRGVLSRGGEAIELTVDHTPKNLTERTRVTAEGGFLEYGTIGGILSVTRAFGDVLEETNNNNNNNNHNNNTALNANTTTSSSSSSSSSSVQAKKDVSLLRKIQGLTAVPVVNKHFVTQDDEFIILACDGLWDVFKSSQAITFVRNSLKKENDMQNASIELVTEALKRGSEDNVSVLILGFTKRTQEGDWVVIRNAGHELLEKKNIERKRRQDVYAAQQQQQQQAAAAAAAAATTTATVVKPLTVKPLEKSTGGWQPRWKVRMIERKALAEKKALEDATAAVSADANNSTTTTTAAVSAAAAAAAVSMVSSATFPAVAAIALPATLKLKIGLTPSVTPTPAVPTTTTAAVIAVVEASPAVVTTTTTPAASAVNETTIVTIGQSSINITSTSNSKKSLSSSQSTNSFLSEIGLPPDTDPRMYIASNSIQKNSILAQLPGLKRGKLVRINSSCSIRLRKTVPTTNTASPPPLSTLSTTQAVVLSDEEPDDFLPPLQNPP